MNLFFKNSIVMSSIVNNFLERNMWYLVVLVAHCIIIIEQKRVWKCVRLQQFIYWAEEGAIVLVFLRHSNCDGYGLGFYNVAFLKN